MGIRLQVTASLIAGAVLLGAGCREDLVAPADGTCPAYCPPEQLRVVDSVLLDNVVSDSTFTGYVQPFEATTLQVYRDSTDAGDAGSRAVLVFLPFSDTLAITSSDTARGPVVATDSFVVALPMRGRNVGYMGLELALYRIPVTTASAVAYADLDPFFADSTLLATAAVPDSALVDTVEVRLDAAAFPDFAADGNQVAVGVALRTASGYVQLGSLEGAAGALVTRYVQIDSAGVAVPRQEGKLADRDTYAVSPLPPAAPDEREIGGTPASRTILRFTLPPRIADSSKVLRATLLLVPSSPVLGAPGDSVGVIAQGLAADVGAKSPLQTVPTDSIPLRVGFAGVGTADTIRLDVTDLVIGWTRDSLRPRVLALRALPEGAAVAVLRMGAVSGDARPRLHITFVPPLTLGGR